MRVISQDGKFDIPYDEIVVEIFGEHVVGRLKEYIGRDILLGSYSTEAKAQKAMEILQNSYYEHEAEKIYREGLNYIHTHFKFPKDEDVEV